MIYGTIFVVSLVYALILYHQARACRPALMDHGFWVVLLWLAGVLVGARYLIPQGPWERVVGAFLAGLLPMAITHFVGSFLREQRLMDFYRQRGENDTAETLAALCRDCSHRDYCNGAGDHRKGAGSQRGVGSG